MDIGIIGAGNIGGTLAVLLANAGHDVVLANSRGPDSLAEQVAGVERLRAGTAAEAAAFGSVVIEAVPLHAVPALPADQLADTIVVSAANYYPDRDGDLPLGDRTHTEWVADQLPGARVVKAFNTIWFRHLATQGDPSMPEDDRRAILLAGDDPDAKERVADLVRELGFAPVDTGGLAAGGVAQQPGAALYNADVTGAEARQHLAGA